MLLLQLLPSWPKTQVWSFSLGLVHASLSPKEQSTSPLPWPTASSLTWPLPTSRGSWPSLGPGAGTAGSLSVPWCCFMFHACPWAVSSPLSVPFFLFLFLLTYSFVFYQDSAKTSLTESQVSLSLSGLLYIIVLTRLDWNVLVIRLSLH